LLLNWLSRETPKNPTVLVAQGSALVPTEPLSAMVSSHEMQLLSAGQLVHASAHGNLAAPSVITRATPPLATHEAWLTDRWQAARDMSGTPLAGTQWVTLELESGCIAHRAVTAQRHHGVQACGVCISGVSVHNGHQPQHEAHQRSEMLRVRGGWQRSHLRRCLRRQDLRWHKARPGALHSTIRTASCLAKAGGD
jgi:hypothetical protein